MTAGWIRRVIATCGATMLVAPVTAAGQEVPFEVVAAREYTHAQQRGIDQAANPEYHARFAPMVPQFLTIGREEAVRPSDVDPFRLDWAPARGREQDVSIVNRYGARMHAHLSWPRSDGSAPFPAVVIATGSEATEQMHRGLAQGLAEAGYIVLGVNVQGDYGSQLAAPDPDPRTPANEYCRPGNWGDWQAPQEMGLREPGACAGEVVPEDQAQNANLLAQSEPDFEQIAEYYAKAGPRKVFGILDATAWLLSDRNPVRHLVDGKRLGVAGHSLGAWGALLAGNGDPLRRFRAVVTWDGFGRLPGGISPRVPTLFQHSDLQQVGPRRTAPDPERLPGSMDAARFRAAGLPSGAIVLRGSSHQEWAYLPHPLVGPLSASRDGERVALHYTRAWFDRFIGPAKARRRAQRRLLAQVLDGADDASSIGQGRWDPVAAANVPPTVAGEPVRDHLSVLYRSWLSLPRGDCRDLRAGCPGPRRGRMRG